MMNYEQNTQYYKLMQEGIALESRGKFEEAIAKYKQAYKIAEHENDSAMYEAKKRILKCKKSILVKNEEELGLKF